MECPRWKQGFICPNMPCWASLLADGSIYGSLPSFSFETVKFTLHILLHLLTCLSSIMELKAANSMCAISRQSLVQVQTKPRACRVSSWWLLHGIIKHLLNFTSSVYKLEKRVGLIPDLCGHCFRVSPKPLASNFVAKPQTNCNRKLHLFLRLRKVSLP